MKKCYLLIGLAVLLISQPASAYLDPGAGSLIWQMLIGIVLGAAFLLKMYWQKTKALFRRIQKDESK